MSSNGGTKVKRIRIQNVLGIEELEFEPGKVTRIQGANATGKTSVIEALKAALGGGHDATLIRQGAEEGEVVLVFEDEMEVRKRIRPGGSEVKVTHPDFGQISAPQTYLDGITDQLTLNPVEFLVSRDRAQLLLEAMPLTITRAELEEAAGPFLPESFDVPDDAHALEVIDSLHQEIYEQRREVNRVAKDKRKTAEQLKGSLPEDAQDVATVRSELKEAEEERSELSTRMHTELRKIHQERQEARDSIVTDRDERLEKLRAEMDEVKRHANELLAGADQRAQQAMTELEEEHDTAELDEKVATLRERLRSADAHANTRKLLEEARAAADEHEEQSRELTQAMAELDSLKLGLLQQLPIEGVEVRDGEVYRGGVPFPRLNHAEQVRIALQVSKLRAGKLPLVPVDGLEILDQEHFDAFVAELRESELQAVVTRVSEGPLTVSTEDSC
jgi:DNA repair exonuclease SbcCD ATPase subunit